MNPPKVAQTMLKLVSAKVGMVRCWEIAYLRRSLSVANLNPGFNMPEAPPGRRNQWFGCWHVSKNKGIGLFLYMQIIRR